MSTDQPKNSESNKQNLGAVNNGNSNQGNPKDKLHIFINKIKFDKGQGVKDSMLGGELADIVSVPRGNAKISRKRDNKEFSVQDTIDIKMADHFEIIRNVVEAGYGN